MQYVGHTVKEFFSFLVPMVTPLYSYRHSYYQTKNEQQKQTKKQYQYTPDWIVHPSIHKMTIDAHTLSSKVIDIGLQYIYKNNMQNKEERIFDPTLFREYLKSKMVSLLESVAGRKLLMLDMEVRVPINLVIEKKVLSDHGVPDQGGIVPFEPMPLPNNQDQIMVFLRPTGHNLKQLKELIEANRSRGNKRYYPCFWPKRTIICKEFFEQNNLSHLVDIRDFSFDLLPIDVDVYSLELKFLKELYIYHDHSLYSIVAESIHRLQCVFGRVHNFYGKGRAAKAISQILKLKQNQIKIDDNYGDIESLIIIDRNCDYLTPLLKQTTYDGMIDQFYGIHGGIVKIPTAKFDVDPNKEGKKQAAYKSTKLNSEKDYVYQQIRGLSLVGVRGLLKARGAQHDNFSEEAARMRDISDKSAAVKRINIEKQLLKTHFQLLSILQQDQKSIGFHKQLIMQQGCLLEQRDQQIIQYYQNMIGLGTPLETIIKNMAIHSIMSKGVHRKLYGKICQDICFTYGLQHIISLTHLANLGIFYQSGSIKEIYPYSDIKKELKLISDEPIDHLNPQDTSFAYGGYVPVAARLVEHAIRNGWRTIMKALRLLPGDVIMPEFQKQCTSHPRPAVVVYFVGGVTHSEIATLRVLGRILRKEMIIATTEILNGESMIRELMQ